MKCALRSCHRQRRREWRTRRDGSRYLYERQWCIVHEQQLYDDGIHVAEDDDWVVLPLSTQRSMTPGEARDE